MRIIVISALALALGLRSPSPRRATPCGATSRRATPRSAPPQQTPRPFDVKPGTELTIPISIVDGKVVAGVPRARQARREPPKDGEITVGLDRIKGELYNQITVTEKTAQPINFLVTGLNGGTKIDETEICGRLDAPTLARIGSVPWRFWVNGFEVGKGGDCNSTASCSRGARSAAIDGLQTKGAKPIVAASPLLETRRPPRPRAMRHAPL